MKNISIWNDFKSSIKCKKVSQDLETNVLIVGGGITGISVLQELKSRGIKALLVERGECGRAVTSRSTAKITYLQEKILMNIRDFVSIEKAQLYLKSQREAIEKLKNIVINNKIDCDFREANSYIFTNKEDNINKLLEEYNFLKDNGINVSKEEKVPFGLDIKLALKVTDTYVFHPLKYINYWKEVYQDIIYENSKLEKINKLKMGYECIVNGYKINAQYVVLATHYPYFLWPYLMPFKNYIETSYIGAFKTKNYDDISAINIDKPSISARFFKDKTANYYIYLFNSFKTANIKNIKENFLALESKYKFSYVWSNKDIITNDYIPFIGAIDGDKTLFLATGYNTWGFSNAILASMVIGDLILKKDNPYSELVNPKRGINFSKAIRFPLDAVSNIKAFIKSNKNNVNNKKVINKTIKGKKVLVYVDEKGKEHIVLNKCPHLKCGLVFNEVEKTWDCLCHGSRFDIDGKCIEGPSNFDISFK